MTVQLDYSPHRVPLSPPRWRKIGGVLVLCIGWCAWWASMFMPTAWETFDWQGTRWLPMRTVFDLGQVFMYAIGFIVQLRVGMPKAFDDELMLFAGFLYALSLLTCWWPIFVGSRRRMLWIARCLGIGLLFSWYFVYWNRMLAQKTPPPGSGDIIWSIASMLIFLSLLIVGPLEPRSRE